MKLYTDSNPLQLKSSFTKLLFLCNPFPKSNTKGKVRKQYLKDIPVSEHYDYDKYCANYCIDF